MAKPLWEEGFESRDEGATSVPEFSVTEGSASLKVVKDRQGSRALEVKPDGTNDWKLEVKFPRQKEQFAISWRMKLENIEEPGNGELIFLLTGSSTGPYFRIRQRVFSGSDAGVSALSSGNIPVPMMKALADGGWYVFRVEVSIPEQKWRYTITKEGSSRAAAEGEVDFLTPVTNLAVLRISPLTPERGAGCDLWIDDLKVE